MADSRYIISLSLLNKIKLFWLSVKRVFYKRFVMDLQTLLKKEEKAGYNDSSVFGGFGLYLVALAQEKQLPLLEELALAYIDASLQERQDLLLAISQELPLLPAQEAGEASVSITTKSKREASLDMPIQYMKGVGPKRAALFQHMGIHTIGDLLFFFPREYQDRRSITLIGEASIDALVSIRGKIVKLDVLRPRPRMVILKAWIQDQSGIIPAIWFNQSFLQKQIVPGREIMVRGRVERKYGQVQLQVQDYEWIEDEADRQGRIVGIYRLTENLNQKILRNVITLAWEKYGHLIGEVLPPLILEKRNLMGRGEAVENLHFPDSFAKQEMARRRMAYEEFLFLQLTLIKNGGLHTKAGIAHRADPNILAGFIAALPFQLTRAQQRVISEIYADMERPEVMARLVQGDVGSGKTIVAGAAVCKAAAGGYQSALMAPTEILAQQHERSLGPILSSLGLRVGLLTGSTPQAQRQELLQAVAEGQIDLLIGTHTLIQAKVNFAHLGLAITDEQHRFGVMQRSILGEKGQSPDVLVMTATPIPRTLALTLYGDLNLSLIDELPPGRKKIKTYAVSYDFEERIFAFLEKEMTKGRQIFVVCPLVEESEKLDLESAEELTAHLQKDVFPQRKVGLLHGRMKAKGKEEIMNELRAGKIDILVSTTVIEVGIDIPNATVMLIRDAERFGLAQLHQLRGRIGRGAEQSYCVLMSDSQTQIAKERLKVMSESEDGFMIAEADLKLRGPGEFFGIRQHGLPELRLANLLRDGRILEEAREDALAIMDLDKEQKRPEFAPLYAQMGNFWQNLN